MKVFEIINLGLRDGVPELTTTLHTDKGELKKAFDNMVKETKKSLKEEFDDEVKFSYDKAELTFQAEAEEELYEVRIWVEEREL